MTRLHVTLPPDLYDELKTHGWSASEVLREALRERLRNEERRRQNDAWYEDLLAKLGPPSPEELEFVDRLVRNTVGREPEP